MIQVKNLTKKYGPNTAVDNLSFTIEKGRIYGFLGPNGAGKSTTMNIITGCLAATSGEVLVGGRDIFEDPREVKKMIGYLPEQPPLYMDMTPYEYLSFVAQAKHIDSARIDRHVKSVMETTHIDLVANRLIKNLSKGFKQRVGIAQALLGNPEIIILDEPTVGLDPVQIIEIRDLIRKLGEDHTVILSSHILPEVRAVCDHIMIISHGKLVASDTPDNLETALAGRNTLEIKARAEAEQIREILAGVEGILEIKCGETEDGITPAEISVENGTYINEAVFFAFAKANAPIVAMNLANVSLENVFLELTGSSELDFAAAASEEASAAEKQSGKPSDGPETAFDYIISGDGTPPGADDEESAGDDDE